MTHPVVQGNRTEARVLAALLDKYDTVLLPYGGNSRYDLAVDDGGQLIRIQCKTGRLRKGVILFKTCSSLEHRKPGTRSSYRGQADLFGVWCPDNQSIYLVPVEDVGTDTGTLRVEPPANRQATGIRWAKDYQLV